MQKTPFPVFGNGVLKFFGLLCSAGVHSLELNKAGALEDQIAEVAFNELAVLLARNVELHAVTALHFKYNIEAGAGVVVIAAGMTVVGILVHHGSLHGQHRGFVVFVPLAEDLHEYEDKHAENKEGNDGEHHRENKGKYEIHGFIPNLSDLCLSYYLRGVSR